MDLSSAWGGSHGPLFRLRGNMEIWFFAYSPPYPFPSFPFPPSLSGPQGLIPGSLQFREVKVLITLSEPQF